MLRETCAATSWAIHLGHGAVHEFAGAFLKTFFLLAQKRCFQARNQALVGGVEAQVLHFFWFAVEQGVALLGGELADRDIDRELARLGVGAELPRPRLVARRENGAVVDGKRVADDLSLVEFAGASGAGARGAHAAGAGVVLDDLLLARRIRQRSATGDAGHVEGVAARPTGVGLSNARVQHAQHGRDVGGGAHRGAHVRAERRLIDDDRGGHAPRGTRCRGAPSTA